MKEDVRRETQNELDMAKKENLKQKDRYDALAKELAQMKDANEQLLATIDELGSSINAKIKTAKNMSRISSSQYDF